MVCDIIKNHAYHMESVSNHDYFANNIFMAAPIIKIN